MKRTSEEEQGEEEQTSPAVQVDVAEAEKQRKIQVAKLVVNM